MKMISFAKNKKNITVKEIINSIIFHKFLCCSIKAVVVLKCIKQGEKQEYNVIQIQTHHILPQFYAAIDTIYYFLWVMFKKY